MGTQSLINIITLNVNGSKDRNKRYRIIEWMKSQKCAIGFLQETHFDEIIERELNNTTEFDTFCSHGTGASKGVAILIKKTLNYKLIDKYSDDEGRIVLTNIEIDDSILTLVCIYAPNCKTARNVFFKKVDKMIKEHGIGISIIAGDFNDTLKTLDRKSQSTMLKNSHPVNSLKSLINKNNLVDVWRNKNENKIQYTWRRKDRSQSSRIDMFLIGIDFMSLVTECKIKPVVIKSTDHQSVFMKIKTCPDEKGKGYWKLNNSILENYDYATLINSLIEKYFIKKHEIQDLTLRWDLFKVEVREVTIEYCRSKAKLARKNLKLLEDNLAKKTELRDNIETQNKKLDKEIENLEREISDIYDIRAKGAQIRSREKWFELGEKNNSYFLGLEKQRQIKKSITKLKIENETITTNQNEILYQIKQYYQNLYSTTNPDQTSTNRYIRETPLRKKLTNEQKSVCDGDINEEECTNCLFTMKLNKSPGLDGLSVEFYKKFWDQLKYILISLFNKGYREQRLSYSQRTSVLSLIFKKGDPLLLNNYRPISLLNVDLKLLSHVLAQRLKKILPTIISEDQTGYIKNRFIGFNLRQIQDIIDYAELYKIEGAIVFVDFSKAFDSLEWDFILTTLSHFGFNNCFIQWVKTLYTDIQTCVINNGWISETFKNSRGIRQGCPLSALLFVLAVEIMAQRLRDNKNIKGINVKLDNKNHSIKISQLADDTTLFCNSKTDVELALNEIEIFGTYSGLIPNRNKTEGLWIGKLKSCKEKIVGINWVEKTIKALGIYFGHCTKECEKLNWEKRIEKMNKLFASWKKRNLTLIGKIIIIKTLIIPIFTFLGSACSVPDIYLKEIESKCFRFLWDDKPDKVKRNLIICPKEEGGLGMIDIKSYFHSLKASWVKRLLTGPLSSWKLIPLKYFNKFGYNWLIFNTNNGNIRCNEELKNIPQFYRDIFVLWNLTGGGKTKKPKSFIDIRKQIIWNNEYLKFEGKTLVFENWIISGILYINDIIDEMGNISQRIILDKLKNKSNWLSEISRIKKIVPQEWLAILKKENSRKSVVNVKKRKNNIVWNNQIIDVNSLSNKILYKALVNTKKKRSQ